MRDVSKVHTRVVVNYDGLSNTTAQLSYDKICKLVISYADMAADDDDQTRTVMELIECKK